MSKNRDSIFPVICLIASIAFIIISILNVNGILEDFKHEEIKAGQVWTKDLYDKNDPFDEKMTITNVVLDVKDRYVLYIRYKPNGENTFKQSLSEYFFAKRAKLLPFKLIQTESVKTNSYLYLDSIITNTVKTITWEVAE